MTNRGLCSCSPRGSDGGPDRDCPVHGELPLAGFMAEIDAEEDAATREALANLKVYDVERFNVKTAKELMDAAGTVIKAWFQRHPDETELVDAEKWMLKAYMQTRKLPGTRYDAIAIRDNNPGLFARLAAAGCLRIDHDVAVAQGLEAEIRRYKVPSGETQALIVKAIE